MFVNLLCIYLIVLNLVSGIIFAFDKRAAIKNRRRIPERNLHLLELLGGVFANILLMYVLRHKNRKFSYSSLTWVVSLTWILLLYRILEG
jgi:uncharacterized membrane protein YsdA (DUF1294 family)